MYFGDKDLNLEKLIFNLKPVVFEAGDAIIEIYKNGAKAEYKEDGSPVTIADRLSEEIILKSLNSIAPNIPIVSEENSISHKKVFSDEYFLVDPLDGTKEFLDFSGSGEFTVNIGLISKNRPIMGIIYSPNSGQLYYGISSEGSFFENNNGDIFNLKVKKGETDDIIAIASKNHLSSKSETWLADRKIKNIISASSSIKFCAIAKGDADVYPRFSPTMEWDTAAGDAILTGAGGRVTEGDSNKPLLYGKPNYRNLDFIAWSKLEFF